MQHPPWFVFEMELWITGSSKSAPVGWCLTGDSVKEHSICWFLCPAEEIKEKVSDLDSELKLNTFSQWDRGRPVAELPASGSAPEMERNGQWTSGSEEATGIIASQLGAT